MKRTVLFVLGMIFLVLPVRADEGMFLLFSSVSIDF